jgi:hypothetical protein
MAAGDRSARAWRIGIVFLGVAMGMLIGAFLAGGFNRPEPSAAQVIGPNVGDIRVGASPDGPTSKVDGVGVGFTHSQEGAVAAATNLVLTLEQAGSTDRQRAVRGYEVLSAEGSRESLAKEMGASWDALHQGITTNGPNASSLFLRTVPVGHEVTRYADDRATVEVWTLTIVAAGGMREALSTWETARVEVVWEHDDWKIWSAESVPGPSPAWATAPVTATDAFLSTVNQLEGYRYVAS